MSNTRTTVGLLDALICVNQTCREKFINCSIVLFILGLPIFVVVVTALCLFSSSFTINGIIDDIIMHLVVAFTILTLFYFLATLRNIRYWRQWRDHVTHAITTCREIGGYYCEFQKKDNKVFALLSKTDSPDTILDTREVLAETIIALPLNQKLETLLLKGLPHKHSDCQILVGLQVADNTVIFSPSNILEFGKLLDQTEDVLSDLQRA